MPVCIIIETVTVVSVPGSMVVAPTTGCGGQQPSSVSIFGFPSCAFPLPSFRRRQV